MHTQVTKVQSNSAGDPTWTIDIIRYDPYFTSIGDREPDSDDLPKDIRQGLLEWLGVDPNTDMDAFFEELYDE